MLDMINPPEHFLEEDFQKWWKEVEEIIQYHKSFLEQFKMKFQAKFDERNQMNLNLLNETEKELTQLKNESETTTAINEISPLLKQSQKINNFFIEKLKCYWDNRSHFLMKSFESIRDFLLPLIKVYNEYKEIVNQNITFVVNEINEIKIESNKKINELELELENKTNQILTLASKEDINNYIDICKQILNNIETEYKETYQKINNIYETQPSLVTNQYNKTENEIMKILHLKSGQNFDENASRISTENLRRSRTSQRNKRIYSSSKISQQSSNIILPNGNCYEIIENFNVIPTFDDFVDDNIVQQNVIPEKKSRQKTSSIRNRKKGKNYQQKGKITKNPSEDIDDFIIPEYNVIDIVPKFDGIISIQVYIPTNDDINDWLNNLKYNIIYNLQNEYINDLKNANYENEKIELKNHFQEIMKVQAPKLNYIEVEIAQNRIIELETHKIQFEKHLKQNIEIFNKGISNLDETFNKRKDLLIQELEKLKKFIHDLNLQKSVSCLITFSQSFNSSNQKFLNKFKQISEEMKNDLNKFVNNFNIKNEKFIEIVSKDISNEEKETTKNLFDKMRSQIDIHINSLKLKIENINKEIENLHQETIQEFEFISNIHKSDLTFIETTNSIQNETKEKYNLILFKSNQQELNIDNIINNLNVNDINETEEKQINSILIKLDELRISLIKRGYYLNVMKSHLNFDPFVFNFSFQTQNINTNEKNPKVKQRNEHIRSKQTIEKIKSKANQQDLNKILSFVTLKLEIEKLENDFITKITNVSNDFYLNLKTRKYQITREALIPQQQNEFIENNKNIWNNMIINLPTEQNNSILHYKTQVSITINQIREIEKEIYKFFSNYYINLIQNERSNIQNKFEINYNKL